MYGTPPQPGHGYGAQRTLGASGGGVGVGGGGGGGGGGGAPMTAEEQRLMQEKFNRIINRMVERLDQPLSTSEFALQRINAKLSLPPEEAKAAPVATNAGAQVIYETVSKAERLHAALLRIEKEIADRTWAVQNPGQRPPQRVGGSAPSPLLAPVASPAPISRPPELLPSSLRERKQEVMATFNDFQDQSRKKGVDYTVMGIQHTKPKHSVDAEKVDEYDEPGRQRASVTPWNASSPISLSVDISKMRWFIGENLQFSIEVLNETTKKIKQLTLTLFKRMEQYALRQVNLKMDLKKELVVHELEVIPSGFPVPARRRHNGKVNFKLPYQLDPSLPGPSKGWIYYVQVRAGVAHHGGPAVILGPMAFERRIL
eukprot:TRINITY_DN2688_c0_g1_i1.p1 TRINITY_DN2688_c0_g1~~TRINITY_DN2688_c0_g1_i1.p1  ORF type:complete len:371 (-),score=54.04 TRINITY_DN2688_c0_g1_i1:159-1271(-)